MNVLVVNLDRCNGCFNCQLACKDEHCDNDWSPLAKPQPMTGQFWCRVNQEERGRVPVVRVAYTPTFCGMCDNAPCLEAAPDGVVYRRDDGIIIIDPEKSQGKKSLVDSCPLGMIYYNDTLDISQKCTGCAHLLDNGWKEPRCVDVCSTGALRFGDIEDFGDELTQAACLDELDGFGAKVYYLNRPKRWIAGTVADRTQNEVIIGARVLIDDESGNQIACIETDDFGDFRYYDCEKQNYHVTIEALGYSPIKLKADCTERDVVFDDIFVEVLG
jgi:Fe-S-cluster-containing dehydrogenase component